MLPRLANPMLQTLPTVPNNTNTCPIPLDPSIDIFDGFGNAGMGVASSLPGHFNKRIEDVSSDSSQDRDNTPFTSPPIISSPMEYPGLSQYNGFPDFNTGLNGHAHGVPTMPMRQTSSSTTFGMMPRSVPEYQSVQREDGGMDNFGMGIGKFDASFR